jgi:Ca-activated chloride channel family protein
VKRSALALIVLAAIAAGPTACRRDDEGGPTRREERIAREIDEKLTPRVKLDGKDGLAAAIVVDVSGSMDDTVTDEDGKKERKIVVARRAAADLVEQFAKYAEEHKDQPVLLGLYEFSRRRGEADCRPVIPMGPPDRERVTAAIASLDPDGGTPIGEAMIAAKKELDATGLTRRHLLLITDGENTDGHRPDRVAQGIAKRPDDERPSIYFVAFDVEASRFTRVRDAGALVLAAANARELNDTLDWLLRGKILLEK